MKTHILCPWLTLKNNKLYFLFFYALPYLQISLMKSTRFKTLTCIVSRIIRNINKICPVSVHSKYLKVITRQYAVKKDSIAVPGKLVFGATGSTIGSRAADFVKICPVTVDHPQIKFSRAAGT
jgi:hypothetical protein